MFGADCKVILALAALGFVLVMLAHESGLFAIGPESFILAEGILLSLVSLYSLWKFDEIDKRLG